MNMGNETNDIELMVAQYLKEKLGVSLEEISKGKEDLQRYRQDDVFNGLRKKWQLNPYAEADNTEFQRRLDLIKGEFSKLSPDEQKVFDSPTGADILWQKISINDKALETPETQTPPRFEASTSSSQAIAGQESLTRDYIRDKMDDKEVKARWSEIVRGYQTGDIK